MLHKTGFDSIVMAATTAVSHPYWYQARKKNRKGKKLNVDVREYKMI
jgi:hypothetical protein